MECVPPKFILNFGGVKLHCAVQQFLTLMVSKK